MSGSKPGAALPVIADQRFLGNFSGAAALPAATEIVAGTNIVLTPAPPGQLIIAATTGSTSSGTVVQVNTGTGLTGGPITVSGTVSLATFTSGFFLGNFSGGVAVPIPVQLAVGSGVTFSAATTSLTVADAPIADQRFMGNYSGGSLAPQAVQLVAGANLTFSATTTSLTITASGSVQSITAGTGLTGGTITVSGTIAMGAPIYPDFTTPVDGDFSWINQGGASVTVNANGGIYLLGPASTISARLRVQSSSTASYTATIAFLGQVYNVDFQFAGMVLREAGSGKLTTWGLLRDSILDQLEVRHWASATSQNAASSTVRNRSANGLIWLRVNYDGTNLNYSWSMDGYNFIQQFTEVKAAFFTTVSDQVGFYVNDQSNTRAVAMTLLSWVKV